MGCGVEVKIPKNLRLMSSGSRFKSKMSSRKYLFDFTLCKNKDNGIFIKIRLICKMYNFL